MTTTHDTTFAATTIPQEIATPAAVKTSIGTLEFKDGAPNKSTLDKVYDDLDFTYAQRAFADTFQGVSIHAIRKGIQSVGVGNNEAIIFSDLMDAKSLWLTTNADTIYIVGLLDLTKGPMVLKTAPDFSAPSRTTGSVGSSTSGCPDPTAARAEST